MNTPHRGIITMAYGSKKYIEMAKTLARSLQLTNPHTPRAIVTDVQDAELEQLFDYCIPSNPKYGSNFRQKLYLDLYSPFEKTMYIDCDSIVVRDLGEMWAAYDGKPFGVVAGVMVSADGYSDQWGAGLDRVMTRFDIDAMPKFNGGVYYFEKSEIGRTIFEMPRSWVNQFEAYGFPVARGDGPDDQMMISVAMALNGVGLFDDNGRFMRTPLKIKGGLNVNVKKGVCEYYRLNEPDLLLQPAIMHFAARWQRSHYYWRESLRVKWMTEPSRAKRLVAGWLPTVLGWGVFLQKKVEKKAPKLQFNLRPFSHRRKLARQTANA